MMTFRWPSFSGLDPAFPRAVRFSLYVKDACASALEALVQAVALTGLAILTEVRTPF